MGHDLLAQRNTIKGSPTIKNIYQNVEESLMNGGHENLGARSRYLLPRVSAVNPSSGGWLFLGLLLGLPLGDEEVTRGAD